MYLVAKVPAPELLAVALAQMPGFDGLCVLEIEPRWADHRAAALAAARDLFAATSGSVQE